MTDNIVSEIVGFVKEFGVLAALVSAAAGTAAFIVFALLALFKRNFEGKSRGKFYAISAILTAFTGALYGLKGIAAEFFFSCAFLYLFYSFVLFILPVRKSKKDKASEEKQRELARYIDERVKKAGELAYAKKNVPVKEKTYGCGGAECGNFYGGDATYEYYEESSSPAARTGKETRGLRDSGGFGGSSRTQDLPLAEIRTREDSLCEEQIDEKSYRSAEKTSGFNDEIDYSHVKNVIARLDYFGLKESDRRQIHDLEASLSEAERGVNSEELKGRINDGLSSLLKIMSKYGA